jgi:glucose-1-phosphate thymidylyltransferase
MKGIILAGGTGSRMFPLTRAVSKQLVPLYDKPMIYYPLSILMLAGIVDVLVITTAADQPAFQRLLGAGSQWGMNLSYAVQAHPGGLAEAFIVGESFLGGGPSCLILGDNIFYGYGLSGTLQSAAELKEGALIFGYPVANPSAYGVAEFDARGKLVALVEKPAEPKSRTAVTGLYFYDGDAPRIAKSISRSARGELEITDLNRVYLENGKIDLIQLGRGIAWLDTGSPEALLQAAQFVQAVQERQGLVIAAPEEIAYRNGWISQTELKALIRDLGATRYAAHLESVVDEVRRESKPLLSASMRHEKWDR